jgi:hypothetical protein
MDPRQVRATIRGTCGEIPVQPDESGQFLDRPDRAHYGSAEVVGGTKRFMVAGARFVEHLNVELR